MDRLHRILDVNGKVAQWPAKHADKQLVLAYLADKFAFDQIYHEREINDTLNQWHTFQDWSLLRRSLVDSGYLQRNPTGTEYRRVNLV